MLVPLAPGTPPGAAQHKARKGDELLGQQALHGVFAVGEWLRLFGFEAMPVALQAQAGNQGDDANGDLPQVQGE
ncbi:hypothetical protein D3C79_1076990 [compost metagenome]